MSTWRILETKEVLRLIRRNAIPKHILEKYEKWKVLVISRGPHALRLQPGLRDHNLSGKLAGLRSSYLSELWRVVYALNQGVLLVTVQQITPHRYGRDPGVVSHTNRSAKMDTNIRKSLDELFKTFRTPKGASIAKRHVTVSVGDTVRIFRDFAALTQLELATKAGITPTSLSAIERGRVELGAKRAKRLAKALGIHPALLLFPDWPE